MMHSRLPYCIHGRTLISLHALAVLAALLVPHSSFATTHLLRIWQEFEAGIVASGDGFVDYSSANFGAGIPGSRSLVIGSAVPSAAIGLSATQSVWQSGANFHTAASLEITATGLGYEGGQCTVSQIFDFDVTDQTETVRLTFPFLVASNGYVEWEFTGRINGQNYGGGSLAVPTSIVYEMALGPGQYQLRAYGLVANPYNTAGLYFVNYSNIISFTNLVIEPGASQSNPVVPRGSHTHGAPVPQVFEWSPRHVYNDPPAANEFSFQILTNSLFEGVAVITNSLFRGIDAFPTGFNNSFEVLAEGESLGSFTTNESVSFTDLLGHGVSSFRVRNITPVVDGSSPTAFPIMLDFTTELASFVMIPNPGVVPIREDNGALDVYFAGVLESSTNLVNWADVPGPPTSPFRTANFSATPRLFFRARQN